MTDTGNPYDSPYVRDLVDGVKSRNELAAGHPDLRQSTPGATHSLGRLRTQRGNTVDLEPFTGGADSFTPGGFSHAGEVALRLFDAAGNAGATGALHPTANPLRQDSHQHRDSATPPNGTHNDDDPRSNVLSTGSPSSVVSGPRAAANAQESHPARGLSNNLAYGDSGIHVNENLPCDSVQSRAVDHNAPNYAQAGPSDHPTTVKHQVLDMLREQARKATNG